MKHLYLRVRFTQFYVETGVLELKEEIKLSRVQRTKAYTEHVKLTARVDGIESRVDDIKEELHEHTTKSHQYS